MNADQTFGRDHALSGANERIDAGRQAFADVWSWIAARLEPSDDAGDAQAAQNMAEDHRSYDIAASGVEKDNTPQLRVRVAGLEEIDKGLRRLRLDHAIGHYDVGTVSATFAIFKRRDTKAHGRAVLLGGGRRNRDSGERDRRSQR